MSTNRAGYEQPTRDADRNLKLVERADPSTSESLLPSMDDGVVLLDIDGSRGVEVVQSLVLDHLLLNDGPAWWIDANGYATTTTLAHIAPSRRLLDRIHVARGFTPYQHYGIVNDLSEAVGRHIRDTSPQKPALIVAPAFDAQYRDADTLSERQARTLQARALARLRAYASAYDVPVLTTRVAVDEFSEPIKTTARQRLQCERTRFGPRFIGDDHETLAYPVSDGYYQTTFAYWRRVIGARAEQVGLEPAGNDQTIESEDIVGTAMTADADRTTLSANPVADAWIGAASSGGQ